MVTRIDLGRPEHEQLFNLAAGIKELNDEQIASGGNPAVVIGKDGKLNIISGENTPIEATTDALASRIRSHCEPGKYKSEKDTSGGSSLVWVEQPSIPRPLLNGYISGGMWPGVPTLKHVVRGPIVRPDFTVRWEPGWDEQSQCWITHSIRKDTTLLDTGFDVRDIFAYFPLTDRALVADLIGCALSPLLTTAIDYPVPALLVTAHSVASGKTLIAQFVAVLAGCGPDSDRGGLPMTATWSNSENEMDKFITSSVKSGERVVILDNIKNSIDSASLESAITSRSIVSRRMYSHDNMKMESSTVWFMTSNGASASSDMARRSVVVSLDKRTSDVGWDKYGPPWVDFMRKPVTQECLVTIMCDMIEKWSAAGAPRGIAEYVGFSDWAEIVAGILEHEGIEGFLEGRDAAVAGAVVTEEDDEGTLVEALADIMGIGVEWTTSELWDKMSDPMIMVHPKGMYVKAWIDSLIKGRSLKSPGMPIGRSLHPLTNKAFGDCDFILQQGGRRKYVCMLKTAAVAAGVEVEEVGDY